MAREHIDLFEKVKETPKFVKYDEEKKKRFRKDSSDSQEEGYDFSAGVKVAEKVLQFENPEDISEVEKPIPKPKKRPKRKNSDSESIASYSSAEDRTPNSSFQTSIINFKPKPPPKFTE